MCRDMTGPRVSSLVWSPDGKRLLVELYEETDRPGIYAPVIYVVDADGLDLTALADGRMPAWEPVFEAMR